MKIGRTYESVEVNLQEWKKLSEECELSFALIKNRLKEVAKKILRLIDGGSLSHMNHPIVLRIMDIIRKEANFLNKM